MIAIHTKFIGPSATRAARIKAYILGDKQRKTVTIGYHDEVANLPGSTDAKYRYAAEMLADHYGWRHKGVDANGKPTGAQRYELLSGGNGDGTYVFIFSPLAPQNAAQVLMNASLDLLKVLRGEKVDNGGLEDIATAMDTLSGARIEYEITCDDNKHIGRA